MPTLNEWETVKAQCAAFNELGYVVKCDIQPMTENAAPAVRIARGMKTWQFADPDWNVVIKQLAQLWRVVHVKANEAH